MPIMPVGQRLLPEGCRSSGSWAAKPKGLPAFLGAQPCISGEQWEWDGVSFELWQWSEAINGNRKVLRSAGPSQW